MLLGLKDIGSVYMKEDRWFLVEGDLASTHIIKPEPVHRELSGLTSNEFFCMRLAKEVGLSVAPVELLHIPEEILVVERFDRRRQPATVERIHIIDGFLRDGDRGCLYTAGSYAKVAAEVIAHSGRADIVKRIVEGTLACCEQMLEVAPRIARVKPD
jgi:HipA-like C-terminal domain